MFYQCIDTAESRYFCRQDGGHGSNDLRNDNEYSERRMNLAWFSNACGAQGRPVRGCTALYILLLYKIYQVSAVFGFRPPPTSSPLVSVLGTLVLVSLDIA